MVERAGKPEKPKTTPARHTRTPIRVAGFRKFAILRKSRKVWPEIFANCAKICVKNAKYDYSRKILKSNTSPCKFLRKIPIFTIPMQRQKTTPPRQVNHSHRQGK